MDNLDMEWYNEPPHRQLSQAKLNQVNLADANMIEVCLMSADLIIDRAYSNANAG
jgi:uncharacterized protein YjbI with pentapeptide repeats